MLVVVKKNHISKKKRSKFESQKPNDFFSILIKHVSKIVAIDISNMNN